MLTENNAFTESETPRMKAHRYLSRASSLLNEMENKKQQLENLASVCEGTQSTDYSREKVTSSPKAHDEIYCIAMQLKKRLDNDMAEYCRVYLMIEERISSLSEAKYRSALTKKYLLGKTNAAAAEEMNYSERHLGRILNEALNEFARLYFK